MEDKEHQEVLKGGGKKSYEKGRPKFYQGRINLVPSDALMGEL